MSSGFYVHAESVLHRLHPVTKVVLLFLGFVSALLLEHPLYLLALAFIYGIFGVRAGALKNLARVAWLLFLIAFASFGIWSVAYHGERVIASLGPLTVTIEGMLFGAGMGVRLDLMVFCGLIFLAATPVEEFSYGLTRLGLPFSISFAMSLSFRLVPLFADTVRTIMDAQRARGLDPASGGLVSRMRSYVPLLVPVSASALRRTDNLAIALESKGFGLGVRRGPLHAYKAGWNDAAALVIMCAIVCMEVIARIYGIGIL